MIENNTQDQQNEQILNEEQIIIDKYNKINIKYQNVLIKQYQKIDNIKIQKIQNYIKQIQNKLQRQKYIITQDIINDYCEYYELENESISPNYQNLKDGKTVAMWFAQNKLSVPKYWYHKPEIQDDDGNTVALIYARHGYIPPQQWCHKSEIQNKYGFTVAMYLAKNKQYIPKQWQHSPELTDQNNDTIAMMQIQNEIIPSQEWMITQNENKEMFNKIKQKLQNKKLPVPKYTKEKELTIFDQACYGQIPKIGDHKPDEQDEDGFTVAMILVNNFIDIPKEWYHDPSIQNKYGETIALMLAKKERAIPKEWEHKPDIQNNEGYTIALIYAQQGRIPPKQWYHNKLLRCERCYNYYYTIQNLLYECCINIPNKWKYTPLDNDENTQAMIQAKNGQIPDKQYYHDPSIINKRGKTVAMLLVENYIIPPKEWMITKGKNQQQFDFIKKTLQNVCLPVPLHTKDEELTIFDQACYHIIPDITGHQPDEQNEDGFTVAMILAINDIKIPKEWCHEPSIENNYKNTVAMYLANNKQIIPKEWNHKSDIQNKYDWTVALIYAKQGRIPPKEWQHDKLLRFKQPNNEYYTIQNILQEKNIEVPNEWKYYPLNDDEDTMEMIQARNLYIPKKLKTSNPEKRNIFGQTVAMILAEKGIIPPEEWYHDPTLKSSNNYTVAMYLAQERTIPPKEWEHDKFMKNNENETVAEILSQNYIIPPPQWMITQDEDKQIFEQICQNLKEYYIYVDNQFVFNVKTKTENDVCQICLTDGEQEFITSKCGHKVCLQCFKEMFKQDQQKLCPNCRQKDWYQKIQEDEQSSISSSDLFDDPFSPFYQ